VSGGLSAALLALGAASAAAWLATLLRPDRPWDLRPVAEDEPEPPARALWPSVAVLVPARNEAGSLPETLPALLAQDYPGPWSVVLVDDRSQDATAALAREVGGASGRLAVVEGEPLPPGWTGKVWALEQGVRAAGAPEYYLLTDADIRHATGSLRGLVGEAEAGGLALTSRMALLRAVDPAERLLIPPFVWFFGLLYPMRRVNDARSRVAASAGGCVLVRREALERAGGLAAIRGEIIDDVNLAQRVKATGVPIRLATSRTDVVSTRVYGSVAAVWRMVRRTAFDELSYSWPLLATTLAALALLFAVPLALVALGAAAGEWPLLGLGLGAWALMAAAYLPAPRHFGLSPAWALTLPLAGLLYGGMTLDSALRHARGRSGEW
jgi:hopene-associated glycosyltransferase HpnB